MISLSNCIEGQLVKIVQIKGTGMIRKRLLEMGFMKGEPVKIVKYAPLRDPMEVVIRETHISLRLKEAELIMVEITMESK